MEVVLENVSKLLGKPVINIYDGNLEGYVKNILVDRKLEKLVWIEIFEDENQEEKILNIKDILNMNCDAVMVKNNSNIFLADTIETNCINPIGYKIYNIEGKYQEKIADLTFDEKNKLVDISLTNNQKLEANCILKVGNGIIIKKDDKNIKLSSFKPKTLSSIEVNTEQTVHALNNKKTLSSNPKKMLATGSEFLIGRKVGQNIYTESKQLIIKKQSKITPHIINIASQNGKLKELTTFSII